MDLGRFRLLEHLGDGGFGTVLAAHDPLLQRKVALKFLTEEHGTHAELLAEARALARLNHANVVAVHEVADVDDRLALVMELVEGQTLDAWVEGARPSRAALLQTMLGAGRGLLAAHELGLVHRDVKPSNILVDAHGHARVADFGLARVRPTETTPTQADRRYDDVPPTRPAGTPRYWAPELHDGAPASPASDQFAYCRCLQEMLAYTHGWTKGPLARALERGLAASPSDRWPDMRALLDALVRAQWRARVRWGSAALGFGACGVLITQAFVEHHAGVACREKGESIEELWNERRAASLRTGFESSGSPSGIESFERVSDALDDYAAKWRDATARTCLAERRGEAWPVPVERTQLCLRSARQALEGALDLWDAPDPDVVLHAISTASSLPPIAFCEDPTRMREEPLPDDPERRRRAMAAREMLQLGTFERTGQRHEEALSLVREALARAESIGWDPLVAEATWAVGTTLFGRGDYEGARQAYQDAYRQAGGLGLERTAAKAALGLAELAGKARSEPAEALAWAASAEALLDRIGEQGRLRGTVSLVRAEAHRARGDTQTAILHSQQALELLRATPEGRLGQISAANQLLGLLTAAGRRAEARALLDEAVEVATETLGPHHIMVAEGLSNAMALAALEEDYAGALELGTRALEIAASQGSRALEHKTLANLAIVELRLGHDDEALRLAERLVALRTDALGPDHENTLKALNTVAMVHQHRADHEAAQRIWLDVLERQRQRPHRLPLDEARTLHNLGEVSVSRNRPKQARVYLAEALEIREDQLPHEHASLANTRRALAGLD